EERYESAEGGGVGGGLGPPPHQRRNLQGEVRDAATGAARRASRSLAAFRAVSKCRRSRPLSERIAKSYWTDRASASRRRLAIPARSLRAKPGTSSIRPANSR